MTKLIETLEQWVESLESLAKTLIHYYDDLHGYPWGRVQLVGILLLGFAFWFGLINLLLNQ